MIKHILLLFMCFSPIVFAQMTEEDVRAKLDLVHNGKINQIRSEIPSLQQKYPNDPGVAYLDAFTTQEGSQAVKKYQIMADKYPKSIWADDALYRIYQYYYAVGLYKTADAKMEKLNKDYPNSIYAKKEISVPQKLAETAPAVQESSMVKEPSVEQKQEPALSQPSAVIAKGGFAVQVGVYSLEPTAIQQSNIFSKTVGKQATVFQKQSNGRTVFAVAFEGFENEQSARLFGSELKSKFNMDWFLVKR